MPEVSPNCRETGSLSRRVCPGANDGLNAQGAQAGYAVDRGACFRPIYTMLVHYFPPSPYGKDLGTECLCLRFYNYLIWSCFYGLHYT